MAPYLVSFNDLQSPQEIKCHANGPKFGPNMFLATKLVEESHSHGAFGKLHGKSYNVSFNTFSRKK